MLSCSEFVICDYVWLNRKCCHKETNMKRYYGTAKALDQPVHTTLPQDDMPLRVAVPTLPVAHQPQKRPRLRLRLLQSPRNLAASLHLTEHHSKTCTWYFKSDARENTVLNTRLGSLTDEKAFAQRAGACILHKKCPVRWCGCTINS